MLFKKKKKTEPFSLLDNTPYYQVGCIIQKRYTGDICTFFGFIFHALCLSHKISLRAKSHPIFGTIVVGLGVLGLKKRTEPKKIALKY